MSYYSMGFYPCLIGDEMNQNEIVLVKNMVKRLDRMIAKERNFEIKIDLRNAAGYLTNVLFEVEE